MPTTQSTTRRLGKPLASIALLAGLAACGSSDPSGTSPSTTPTTPTTPGQSTVTVSPPHDFAEAKQVTVVQSGGLKPIRKTFVFAMDRPAPDGFTRADVKAVLQAAGNPALKKPQPTPRDTCCDRYLYRISISYPDGTSTTFTTVEGAPTTPAASRLLSLAT
jgi:hypothetical protein